MNRLSLPGKNCAAGSPASGHALPSRHMIAVGPQRERVPACQRRREQPDAKLAHGAYVIRCAKKTHQ